MANVRIEYLRPLYAGHVHDAIDAVSAVVDWFAVADTATVAGSRPVVPADVFCAMIYADAPVIVAWGDDPTAALAGSGILVPSGPHGRAVIVRPGAKLSFINATSGPAQAVASPQIVTKTATIANGASLSGAVDLGTGRVVGIIFPAAWTTAAITFSASADGTNYFDLYDDGTERAIASGNVVASRFLALGLVDWLAVRSLKVRSGTSASPVNQGGARDITLVVAP